MNGRHVGRMLLLISALGALACQNQNRQPFIYEIPEGYKGWVTVHFFRPDCPQAPMEGDKPVLRIPGNGRLCTGTILGFGDVPDEYFFVDASGKRTDAGDRVHQDHVAIEGASPTKRIYKRFYVGTDEDFKSAPPEPRGELIP